MRLKAGLTTYLNAAVIHGEIIWVFGDSGIVRLSEDSGATWQNHTNLGDANLISADSYENSMAVISSEGIIYMKDDFESEWITIDSSQMGMKSVALTGAKSLVIVGNEGAIWQYTDQTWWNRTTSFMKISTMLTSTEMKMDWLLVIQGPFLQQMMVAPHGIIGSHQTQIVQSFLYLLQSISYVRSK